MREEELRMIIHRTINLQVFWAMWVLSKVSLLMGCSMGKYRRSDKTADTPFPTKEHGVGRYGSRSGGIVYKAWPFDNYDEAGGHGPERPIQADKG